MIAIKQPHLTKWLSRINICAIALSLLSIAVPCRARITLGMPSNSLTIAVIYPTLDSQESILVGKHDIITLKEHVSLFLRQTYASNLGIFMGLVTSSS